MIISISEAGYIDPRAGNDKFYRVFVLGSSWVSQYGRNGTAGTFTKLIELATPEAAQKAADAKFAAKVKKGYNPVRAGQVDSSVDIDQGNLALLDELAGTLPLGESQTIVTEPVNPVDLGAQVEQPLTSAAREKIETRFHGAKAAEEDLRPMLPVRPMLASVQDQSAIDTAMLDHAWLAQFKYDGDRVVIEVSDGQIRVLNRQGQEKTRNVGAAHLRPFTALDEGRWVFDGEVVGRTLVLFDLIMASDGTSTWSRESNPFLRRYYVLELIAGVLGIMDAEIAPADAPVVLAPVATDNETKLDYLAQAVRDQREGLILRHTDGPYESGRRSTTLVKHKLIKDADVIVTALHDTKQSATLSVHALDGSLLEVGSASTIGKGDVSVGDVWQVSFLYVTDPQHPRMVQPRLILRRSDKNPAECSIEQFADAGTNKVV